MTDKVLIDTNVLVYAYDSAESIKQETAINELDKLVTAGNSYISTQILSEFFVAVTKKIPVPLTVKEAEQRINNFCQIWPVLHISEMIIIEAIRGVKTHNLSYWDALIWGTARLNQIGLVLSEDFSNDSSIEGVRFHNHFV